MDTFAFSLFLSTTNACGSKSGGLFVEIEIYSAGDEKADDNKNAYGCAPAFRRSLFGARSFWHDVSIPRTNFCVDILKL